MRANSGLMSTIVGSLPGNIALKYILSNLDEKHNIYISKMASRETIP